MIGLNDSKVFEAFCSNIYAKVAVLSDGEYKLYVDHQGLVGVLPTHSTGSTGTNGTVATPVPQYESASITPRTMNAVINTPITATVGGTEPIIIKEYQEHILQNGYSNLYVIRFAIKFDPSDPVSLNSHILPNSISGLTQIEQDIFMPCMN